MHWIVNFHVKEEKDVILSHAVIPIMRKQYFALWIMCVGQIVSVSFKMLNCQHVGDRLVHFYFAEECWQSWTMGISLISLVIVLVIFIALLVVLWRTDPRNRQDQDYPLRSLCKYYTVDCYYWEFVMLIRRLSITSYAILYTRTWFPLYGWDIINISCITTQISTISYTRSECNGIVCNLLYHYYCHANDIFK